jgi:hypothetical protein
MGTRSVSAVPDIGLPVLAATPIGHGAGQAAVFGEATCRAMTRFRSGFAIRALRSQILATATLPATVPWGKIPAFYLAVFRRMRLGMVAGRTVHGRRPTGQRIVERNDDFW